MIRRLCLTLVVLLPLVAHGAVLPRTFGKLKLGMPEAQVTEASGADFSGWCASCPPNGDETSIGPEHFYWFSAVFPGLTATKWMPKDAIVLLTTNGKLSGIILHPEEKDVQILSILKKQLGNPPLIHSDGTAEWKDEKTIIQCDSTTVRIYDRKASTKKKMP